MTVSRIAATALVLSCAAGPAWASTEEIVFEVFRGGDEIGRHVVTLTTEGARTTAEIEIDLAVQVAFITVYRYTHRNTEVWENGQLVSMTSTTDDNGDKHFVRAVRDGSGQLTVEGSDFNGVLPADVLPTTYWSPDFVRQAKLLNSQTGAPIPVTITPTGQESVPVGAGQVTATRYVVDGELQKEIWYDAAGSWVKTRFKAQGAEIEYRRVAPGADVRPAQG